MLTWTSTQYHATAIAVAFDRYDGERCQYRWTIDLDASDVTSAHKWEATDLRLGSAQEPSDVEALQALASFLDAWCEANESSYPEAENRDLFPAEMRDAIGIRVWRDLVDEMRGDVGDRSCV